MAKENEISGVTFTAKELSALNAAIDLQIKSHQRAARAQQGAGRQAIADALALLIEDLEVIQRRIKTAVTK